MVRIIPQSNGFQRLDEGVDIRYFESKERLAQVGRNCQGCSKFYNYLRAHNTFCLSCQSRRIKK